MSTENTQQQQPTSSQQCKSKKGILKGILITSSIITGVAVGAVGHFLYGKYKGE